MNNILLSSAVLTLSQPTKSARDKSIDITVMHLITSKGLEEFSVEDIYAAIKEEIPLRIEVIAESLERSLDNGFIIEKRKSHKFNDTLFCVSEHTKTNISKESNKISDFLEESLWELFEDIISDESIAELKNVLLEAVARLMGRYGYVYAGQLANGGESENFTPKEELLEICENVLKKCTLNLTAQRLAESIGLLFDRRDPCLNNLAFSLCHRYYTSRLLGLDLPSDFFSQNIYQNSRIFLDTNFLLSVAFSKANRHNEFAHILKNSDKLGIKFCASEITVAEIEQRVMPYKEWFDKSENKLPSEVIDEIQESLLEREIDATYFDSEVANTPNFQRIEKLGVEIVPVGKGAKPFTAEEFALIKGEISDYDDKYRNQRRKKDDNAIVHDSYIYFLIQRYRTEGNMYSAWFLTNDNSIIQHSLSKKTSQVSPYSIRLITLLHTLSMFVESHGLQAEYEDLFADLISKDLLPSEQVLTLDDLKLFIGFDVRAKATPPEFLRKALHHVKTNVLMGGGITDENRSQVVQEFVTYLATPETNFREIHKKYERLINEKDQEISKILKSSSLEKSDFVWSQTNSVHLI